MNSPPNSCFYEFEGFVLDPLQRVVRTLADNQTLRLTARAFDALHLLVSHHGQLVDKDTLIKMLWPKVVVEENNLTQIIHALRQSLGEKPGEHRFIATAPGRGYRFVAVVKEIPRPTDSNSEPTDVLANGTSDPVRPPITVPAELADISKAPHLPSRSLLRWSALAVVLGVIASAWWLAGGGNILNTPAVHEAATIALPRSSIAVLPFVNLTGDPGKEYLGDGMADELINTLTSVPGLKVPARTSTFAYKSRNTDIRQIAKDLGVDTILEGSVRAADNHIRVSVQLINAKDGLSLWSQTFDEEFRDIFKLQDKLATQITKALQPNLSEAALVHAPPTQDVEAYQRYLQAGSLMDQPAIDLLSQAVARDPDFTQAYGKLAVAHISLYLRGGAADHMGMARKFAQQALTFGPNAQAQSVLAELSLLAGDWKNMDARDNVILALPGADASLISHRSTHLMWVGKLHDAEEIARQAYNLAPAAPRVVQILSTSVSVQEKLAEATKLHELAITLGLPRIEGVTLYARAARDAGDYAQSAEWINTSVGRGDMDVQATERYKEAVRIVHAALADARKRDAALEVLKRTFPLPPTASSNPIPLVKSCMMGVRFYVQLQTMDEAYALAKKCPEIGNGMAAGAAVASGPLLLWGSEMRSFRRDPRFQAFATRTGLMEYWKQSGTPDDCDLKDGKLTCH